MIAVSPEKRKTPSPHKRVLGKSGSPTKPVSPTTTRRRVSPVKRRSALSTPESRAQRRQSKLKVVVISPTKEEKAKLKRVQAYMVNELGVTPTSTEKTGSSHKFRIQRQRALPSLTLTAKELQDKLLSIASKRPAHIQRLFSMRAHRKPINRRDAEELAEWEAWEATMIPRMINRRRGYILHRHLTVPGEVIEID